LATIGTLAVNIVATTDKFIAGLNNASGRLGKFVKGVGVVQGALAGLAATGLAAVVKGAIDAGGAIFDMSQKLKISTEALTALHFAATQLGASAGAVDNAISKMNVTLGKAISGDAMAQEAFALLGLSWNELVNIPVDKQFLAVVDAINKIPSVAGRASAAQDIFGRGAKELAALISAGTDEIIKFGDEAARTGAVLTTEQAAALDETSDAIAAFSTQWQTLTQSFVSFFAPAITIGMKTITESIKFLHSVVNTFQVIFLGGLAAIEYALYGIVKVMNILLPKFLEFTGLEQDFKVGAESFGQAAGDIGRRIDARHGIGGSGPLEKAAISTGPVQTDKQLADKIKLDRKMEGIQTKEDLAKQRANDKLVRQQLAEMKAANIAARQAQARDERLRRVGINQSAGLEISDIQAQKARLKADPRNVDKDVAKNTAQQVKQLDVLIAEIRQSQKLKLAGVR
jgi:hypothetical protein